jgi:hypothetical protein
MPAKKKYGRKTTIRKRKYAPKSILRRSNNIPSYFGAENGPD